MIIVEGCPNLKAVTLFVRGGNKMVIDEVCLPGRAAHAPGARAAARAN
jgi:hypothetical protein